MVAQWPDRGRTDPPWDDDLRAYIDEGDGDALFRAIDQEMLTMSALAQRELDVVRQFIGWLNGKPGQIGEVGWPNSTYPNNTGIDHRPDLPKWHAVAEYCLRELDKVSNIWITAFMAGSKDLQAHPIAPYHNTVGDGPLDFVEPNGLVLERHLGTGFPRRGMNLDATDWTANTTPSTTLFPDLQELQFVKGRGYDHIRVHLSVNKAFYTNGWVYEPGYKALVDQLVADCATAGLGLVLLLNWDRGVNNDGTYVKLHKYTGDFTEADLISAWGQFSDAYKNNPAVIAYAIGNEPHDLAAIVGSGWTQVGAYNYQFPADVMGFTSGNAETSVSWEPTLGNLGAGSLKATSASPTRQVNIFALTPAVNSSQQTMRAFVRRPAASAGIDWKVRIGRYGAGVWSYGPYVDLPNSKIDQWVEVSYTPPGGMSGAYQPMVVNVQGYANVIGVYDVYIDDVQNGNYAQPPMTAQEHYRSISQAVVDNLRNVKADTKEIIVPIYNWGNLHDLMAWQPDGPWIVDALNKIRYDGHLYFDYLTGSAYTDTFAEVNQRAITQNAKVDRKPPGLAEAGNVLILNPADGQVLKYDATSKLWKNVAP